MTALDLPDDRDARLQALVFEAIESRCGAIALRRWARACGFEGASFDDVQIELLKARSIMAATPGLGYLQ